jgi:RNA polymerase sigma-70 factor (ECF subfamily)
MSRLFADMGFTIARGMENESPEPRDAQIVSRVLSGDVNAFEHLVRRYQHLVIAVARRHVPFDYIEDTMQDIYLRAYRSLPGFKMTDSFAHWLSVIAVRTCYDFWRKYYRSPEMPVSSLTGEQQARVEAVLACAQGDRSREEDVQREAAQVLDLALGRLSPADRMAVELVYFDGRSVKEAAGLLGWSAANVKVRLFRARKKLRQLLDHKRQEDGR